MTNLGVQTAAKSTAFVLYWVVRMNGCLHR